MEVAPPAPYGPPIWTGPSELVLGTAFPINHLFAKTDELAVVLELLHAYPNGFTFTVAFQLRPPAPFDAFHPHRLHEVGIPRFGFEFSNGQRVGDRTFPGMFDVPKDDNGIPTQPVLIPQGGGGGSSRWAQNFWVWPLPSAGPMVVYFAWPHHGIEESKLVLDGAEIRAAGENAPDLWPTGRDPEVGDQPRPAGGTWRTLGR